MDAQIDATAHAQDRAKRDNAPMIVYRDDKAGANAWGAFRYYVRPLSDPAPEGAGPVSIHHPDGSHTYPT